MVATDEHGTVMLQPGMGREAIAIASVNAEADLAGIATPLKQHLQRQGLAKAVSSAGNEAASYQHRPREPVRRV